MRLSTQDRIEFMKAAVKATDRDSLIQWVVSVVDAIDELPEGKSDVPCPPYRPVPQVRVGNGQATLIP